MLVVRWSGGSAVRGKRGASYLESRYGLPSLVGLSVVIALLLELFVVHLRAIPFPLLALVFGLPPSTLRATDGQILWLGARHTAVCCASVLGAWLPFLMIVALNPFQPYAWTAFRFPPRFDALAIAAFIALEGGLSAWLMISLHRWIDREAPVVGSAHIRQGPRPLGVAGMVGGTFVLAGLAGLLWITMILPVLTGRIRDYAWMSQREMAVLSIVGLGFLAAECIRRLLARR